MAITTKPIVVRLTGGLGNQIFTVAAGLGISRLHNLPLVLDASAFAVTREIRSDSLACYDLPFERIARATSRGATVQLVVQGSRTTVPSFEEDGYRFDPKLVELCVDGGYITGYFQSPKYFDAVKDEVVSLFRDKVVHEAGGAALKRQISECNSVGVHVRRGDYLKTPAYEFHGLCETEYFRRAIELMRERQTAPRFFVFSDDPDWCSKNFNDPDVIVASGARTPNADLDLLASCKHHILSNSSFSWWGAYLARHPKQAVIAPGPWYTRVPLAPDLIPANWQLLHRSSGEAWSIWEDRVRSTRVSVVVPSHRRIKPLNEAVQSALLQTHENLDITIVLSAATDDVKAEAGRLAQENGRVHVVTAPTAGLAIARNTGIRASTDEWIAILDDDDVWHPDKLRTQLTAALVFDQDAVSCEHSFSGPGLEKFKYPPGNLSLRDALILENYFSGGSAAIFRRTAYDSVNGFDERLFACEDHDFWRRLSLNNKMMIVAEPLLEIRRLDGSMQMNSLVMFQANAQHLVKIMRECPPDLAHLLEGAMRNTFNSFYLVAIERGYQLIDARFAGDMPFFLLLKLLVLNGAIKVVRFIDWFAPGSFDAAKRFWSSRRRFS
jgi:glycosyltransferase involved in cell wall biosynthesis